MDTPSTPFEKKAEDFLAANLLRWRAGRNKAEAARILGLTPADYGRYEAGGRLPAADKLIQMARIIGAPAEALLSDQMVIEPMPAHGLALETVIRAIVKDEIGILAKKLPATTAAEVSNVLRALRKPESEPQSPPVFPPHGDVRGQ